MAQSKLPGPRRIRELQRALGIPDRRCAGTTRRPEPDPALCGDRSGWITGEVFAQQAEPVHYAYVGRRVWGESLGGTGDLYRRCELAGVHGASQETGESLHSSDGPIEADENQAVGASTS